MMTFSLLMIIILAVLPAWSLVDYTPGGAMAAQVPVFVNDWTGEYTTDFETYYNASQVEVFGQSVFISKRNFILVSSVFGALFAGILVFVLFKAIL